MCMHLPACIYYKNAMRKCGKLVEKIKLKLKSTKKLYNVMKCVNVNEGRVNV